VLRIGIVGCGKIAETFHLPAWDRIEAARVVAIVDPDLVHAQSVARRFGIPRTFPSLADMLAGEQVDAIDICAPSALHASIALVALRAGCHVVVEKPLATTAADARVMAREARQANRVLMCAQHQRFRPESAVAKKLVESGSLGRIYWAKAQLLSRRGVPNQRINTFTDRAMAGGGPLFDQGSHVIDLAWWLMGRPPAQRAWGATFRHLAPQAGSLQGGASWSRFDVEELALGQITFANGAVLTVETSYFLNATEDLYRVELFGTEAGLRWPELIVARGQSQSVDVSAVDVDRRALASVAELRHFVELVGRKAEPLVPVEDSIAVVSMIECCYKSAERGSELSLVTSASDIAG